MLLGCASLSEPAALGCRFGSCMLASTCLVCNNHIKVGITCNDGTQDVPAERSDFSSVVARWCVA